MKKGFTIVEVLVVIGIIAILTAIVLPSISGTRAKNRDAERVADISAIQLGLSLYRSQLNGVYPTDIYTDPDFISKYVTSDSLYDPNGSRYIYVPLAKSGSTDKCTYYHLGAVLELPSGQIDTADDFTSKTGSPISNGYVYCTGYSDSGLGTSTRNYNVHP